MVATTTNDNDWQLRSVESCHCPYGQLVSVSVVKRAAGRKPGTLNART